MRNSQVTCMAPRLMPEATPLHAWTYLPPTHARTLMYVHTHTH